jgi:hypothetical protein
VLVLGMGEGEGSLPRERQRRPPSDDSGARAQAGWGLKDLRGGAAQTAGTYMPPQRSAEACAADGGYLYTARTASRRIAPSPDSTVVSFPLDLAVSGVARDGSTLPDAVDEDRV